MKSIITLINVLIINLIFLGLPIMFLWNWLMPLIFNLPKITFFQSCGLYIMLWILIPSSSSTNKII